MSKLFIGMFLLFLNNSKALIETTAIHEGSGDEDPIYKDDRLHNVNTNNITNTNNQTNNGYLGSNNEGSAAIISNLHADSVEESSIESALVTNDNSKTVATSGEINDKLSEQKTTKSTFEIQSKISDESTSKSVHIFSRQTPESTIGILIRRSTEPIPTIYGGKLTELTHRMISEDSTQSTYGIFSEQTKESTPENTPGKITESTPIIITDKNTDSTSGIIKQTTESTNKTDNVSANRNDNLDITMETATTKVSKSRNEDLYITTETATTKVSKGHDRNLDITMETPTTKVSKGHDEDLDITMETATTKVSKGHNEDLDITTDTATTKVSKGHNEELDITTDTPITKVSKGHNEDLDITTETPTTKVSKGHDEDLYITTDTPTTKVPKDHDEDLYITTETPTTKVPKDHDEDLYITTETTTIKVSKGHGEESDISVETTTSKVSKGHTISLTTEHEKGTMESESDITEPQNLSMSTGQIILDSTTNQQLDLISTLPGIKDNSFSVKSVKRRPESIILLVEKTLPKETYCKEIEFMHSNGESSRTDKIKCSGTVINKTKIIKGLDIGVCYQFEIFVTTTTGKTIGPHSHFSCTKPKRPSSSSKIVNRTVSALVLQIQHPAEGQFDSFEINYKLKQYIETVFVNRSLANTTLVELSPLEPGTCYNISVYTVSNSENSAKPRMILNECLLPSRPGQNHSVVFNTSSFTVSWAEPVGYIDTYVVDVFCHVSTGYTHSVSLSSVQVSGVTPGDCCRLNVTTQSHHYYSTPQLYYVYLNETVPDSIMSITTNITRSKIVVTWQPPVHSNGWLFSYTVRLYDETIQEIHTFVVECTQSPVICHEGSYKQNFQCSNYELLNDTGKAVFVDHRSMFGMSIGGLHPGSLYYYSVESCNKAGTSSSKKILVYTLTDKPLSQIKNADEGNSSIRLEFEVPCEDIPLSITYNISYTSLNQTCSENEFNITRWKSCYFGGLCEITGLYSYQDYYIQVQETVEHKVGIWSEAYLVKTLPYNPDNITNLKISNYTSTSLTVCWDKPCFVNGFHLEYEVTIGGKSERKTGLCCEIEKLSPYTVYNVSVVAINNYGRSLPSYVYERTDVAKPSKPTGITLRAGPRHIRVDWSPLEPYPGPTNYTVEVRDVEVEYHTNVCYSPAFNKTFCIVEGLEEYWNYEVTVTAHTIKGDNISPLFPVVTHQAASGPVTNFNVEPETNPEDPRQIYVKFAAPQLRDRNGKIVAYYIKCTSVVSGEIISVIKLVDVVPEIKIRVPDQLLLNISVFAETIENGTEVYATVIVPVAAKDFPVAEAIAGVLPPVLVFVIFGLILAIFYKKQKYCFKPPPKERENIHLKEGIKQPKKKISVETEDRRKSRPIKIDRFYQHVDIMARDCNHFFSKEYKELRGMAPSFSTEAAAQQEARTKNRYSNILPFDHSRVKLFPLDDEEGSDYINANYIPGFNSKREYIATQGPLPSTKDDFWRMVWEQNVSVIVMLTQCIERGKRKCESYWPESMREPVYYGDLCIEMENESHLPEYILRTISIQLGNIRKQVMHFLYLAWPDMGVPSSTDNMIALVKTVRSHVHPSMKGPLAIHCSAGVGRTGTFIAVDIFLHQLTTGYNQMDIFGDVLKLRNHRCNMVQTEDQYIFIHHCISDYILALNEDADEEEAVDGGDEPLYQNVPGNRHGPN